MKLSLVLIIYRSKSTIAKETASFCENLLESQKIAVFRLASNFDNKTLQRNLEKNDYLPDLVIVLGGMGLYLNLPMHFLTLIFLFLVLILEAI